MFEEISIIKPNILLGGISPNNDTKSFFKEKNMQKIIDMYGIDIVISVYDFLPNTREKTTAKRFFLIIYDSLDSDIGRYFKTVGSIIRKAERRGKRIFIHCHMGISRSVTLLISYLMRYYRMNVQRAIKYLRERRPYIQPNIGFLKQLYIYEDSLKRKMISKT